MASTSPFESMKQKANDAFKAKNYAKAITLYSDCLKLEPENAIIYANRSYCYTLCGQFSKAVSDADKSIQLNPSWQKSHLRRAQALRGLKRYDASLAAVVDCIAAENATVGEHVDFAMEMIAEAIDSHQDIGIHYIFESSKSQQFILHEVLRRSSLFCSPSFPKSREQEQFLMLNPIWQALRNFFPGTHSFLTRATLDCGLIKRVLIPFLRSNGIGLMNSIASKMCVSSFYITNHAAVPVAFGAWCSGIRRILSLLTVIFNFFQTFSSCQAHLGREQRSEDVSESIPRADLTLFQTVCSEQQTQITSLYPLFITIMKTMISLIKATQAARPTFEAEVQACNETIQWLLHPINCLFTFDRQKAFDEFWIRDTSFLQLLTLKFHDLYASLTNKDDLFHVMQWPIELLSFTVQPMDQSGRSGQKMVPLITDSNLISKLQSYIEIIDKLMVKTTLVTKKKDIMSVLGNFYRLGLIIIGRYTVSETMLLSAMFSKLSSPSASSSSSAGSGKKRPSELDPKKLLQLQQYVSSTYNKLIFTHIVPMLQDLRGITDKKNAFCHRHTFINGHTTGTSQGVSICLVLIYDMIVFERNDESLNDEIRNVLWPTAVRSFVYWDQNVESLFLFQFLLSLKDRIGPQEEGRFAWRIDSETVNKYMHLFGAGSSSSPSTSPLVALLISNFKKMRAAQPWLKPLATRGFSASYDELLWYYLNSFRCLLNLKTMESSEAAKYEVSTGAKVEDLSAGNQRVILSHRDAESLVVDFLHPLLQDGIGMDHEGNDEFAVTLICSLVTRPELATAELLRKMNSLGFMQHLIKLMKRRAPCPEALSIPGTVAGEVLLKAAKREAVVVVGASSSSQ